VRGAPAISPATPEWRQRLDTANRAGRALGRYADGREPLDLAATAAIVLPSVRSERGWNDMARIALIKPFTGLNLGVSQLSAELQRAGHDSRVIYFKDYVVAPVESASAMCRSEYAGTAVGPRGQDFVWNCYRPVTDREHALLLQELEDFQPQLVGLSLTSAGFGVAAEITRLVQEQLGVPVIWGGTGPTLEPERCLQWADLVCINEGEEVIRELAERIDEGLPLGQVVGVWEQRDGRIIRSENRPLLDIESIAIPDFDPSRTVHIENDAITRNVLPHNLGNQYVIMTSRGCPFSCSFCIESVYQDMFGKKGSLRRRSVDVVIEELRVARDRYDIQSVMFYDDVFTTHRKWLLEFAPRYEREIGLPFWCYTYPTTTRAEDIRLLAAAGCASMTMGIQSGSERILREYFNRPTPLDQARAAMQTVLDAGVQCFFDLITNVEFETEADLQSTFEFLMSLPKGVQCVGFGHMVQFPTYGYTAKVSASAESQRQVPPELYAYYHRLYWLALSDLSTEEKRAIAADPSYRAHPERLEPLLTNKLPFSFIPPRAKSKIADGKRVLDVGIAQAVVDTAAEGVLDEVGGTRRGGPPDRLGRRLPVLT
jgi:anaerobic magnesium-protoporphyrin IX monomethyl ester cyclase